MYYINFDSTLPTITRGQPVLEENRATTSLKVKICVFVTIAIFVMAAICWFWASGVVYIDNNIEISEDGEIIAEDHVTPLIETEENITKIAEPEENITKIAEPEENITKIAEPEENIFKIAKPEKNWNIQNQTNDVATDLTLITTPTDEQCDNLYMTENMMVTGFLWCVKKMNISLHQNLDDVKLYTHYFENCESRSFCGGKCYVTRSKYAWNSLRTWFWSPKMSQNSGMTQSVDITSQLRCMKKMNISQDELQDHHLLKARFYDNCKIESMYCGQCYTISPKQK